MRVLLVYGGHPRIDDTGSEEHLGLAYLAAVLREDGHQVTILDGAVTRASSRELFRGIWERRNQFDLLGFSCPFTDSLEPVGRLATVLRDRGLQQHFTVGGHPPTFLAREMLERWPAYDSVVVGEGEETFRELVEALDSGLDWTTLAGLAHARSGQATVNPRRPLIADLDQLPFPARDTLAQHAQREAPLSASVLKSRGCYGQCSFCDTVAFYRSSPGAPWRSRSPADVAEEIEELARDRGVTHIRFWDDNFIGPGRKGRRLAEELATQILDRRLEIDYALECRVDNVDPELFQLLKESGLKRVFLGIESGVQRALDTFNKGVTVEQNTRALETLRELDLDVRVGFILLDPYTTLEELLENLDWLRDNVGPTSHIRRILTQPLNILEVYEGAPIMQRLREDGLLRGSFTGYAYRFADRRVDVLVQVLLALRKMGFTLKDAATRARRAVRAGGEAGPQARR